MDRQALMSLTSRLIVSDSDISRPIASCWGQKVVLGDWSKFVRMVARLQVRVFKGRLMSWAWW